MRLLRRIRTRTGWLGLACCTSGTGGIRRRLLGWRQGRIVFDNAVSSVVSGMCRRSIRASRRETSAELMGSAQRCLCRSVRFWRCWRSDAGCAGATQDLITGAVASLTSFGGLGADIARLPMRFGGAGNGRYCLFGTTWRRARLADGGAGRPQHHAGSAVPCRCAWRDRLCARGAGPHLGVDFRHRGRTGSIPVRWRSRYIRRHAGQLSARCSRTWTWRRWRGDHHRSNAAADFQPRRGAYRDARYRIVSL